MTIPWYLAGRKIDVNVAHRSAFEPITVVQAISFGEFALILVVR